ncbi:hypothetical protein LTR47_011277 [Exophiala xenobiotica]|nr:hypothetical protein LTR92_011213 [Exophiala xenobiotica]KAK5220277.1 hypothetical protein LTR47_011277 [Exophiala xenobiotica]KAK5244334.1 hypothetical protein LTS06_010064 [Exophiala xenobiotica]KAK5260882.1 hypothetical protein LTR40_003279 [Exophiala xenobiotica]KAK5311947.1 hypothetical protein LTR93_011535 [Exophiala xenobiotica]
MQSQPKIIELIEKFLDITSSSSKPFNIHDYIHNLFLDTTSQLSFGNSFNLLSGHDHPGARDIEAYFTISPFFGVFPIAKYLPFGIFRAAREARPRIVASVQNCINDLRDRLRVGTAQHGLLRIKVEAKDGETGTAFSDEELIENAVLFIIAGSGTTATTLIYLMYEVGKRPEIQARLEEEIRDAFPDDSLFPNFDIASNLPYLNGVLQEVLRLRSPIPTVAPRISPGKVISGQYILLVLLSVTWRIPLTEIQQYFQTQKNFSQIAGKPPARR